MSCWLKRLLYFTLSHSVSSHQVFEDWACPRHREQLEDNMMWHWPRKCCPWAHRCKQVRQNSAALRQIRTIRRCLKQQALAAFFGDVTGFNTAGLWKRDVSWSLAGLPANLIRRLQSVFNAAARLVFSLRKYDRVTPLLQQLHWLKVEQRIEYKLAVLVFRCLHGLAPPYLANDPQCVSNLDARRRLYLRSRHSDDVSVHRRRPCLSCRCHTYVEQSTGLCHVVTVAAHAQTSSQDSTFCS